MTGDIATPAARPHRRRLWPWLLGVFLALAALLGGVARWTGTTGSLPRALEFAQRLLPDGQQLQYGGVEGSLAGGGRIAHLQWSQPGTVVTVEDLRLEWSLRQLFSRDLRVRVFSARSVHLRLTRKPDQPDEPPFTMPASLTLPLKVTVPLHITQVQIESVDEAGVASLRQIDDLDILYRYDGTEHALRVNHVRYGQSQAQAALRLHARSLALSAQVAASLRDLAPDVPFAMLTRLQADGSLAGGDAAKLNLLLEGSQQPHDASPPDPATLLAALATLQSTFVDAAAVRTTAAAAQIHAQATVHPWRAQPAQQLDLQVSSLNAHAFGATAPTTALRGRATLQPTGEKAGTGWDAVLAFTNDQPGAWDRQQLPLRSVVARVHLSLEKIDMQSARVELGARTADGAITLTGSIPLQQAARSTVQVDLHQVDLRAVMTTLPRTALDGPASIRPQAQDSSQILVDIRNALSGPLDQERAPFERLIADLRIAPDQWRAEKLELQVGSGRVQIDGDYAPETQTIALRGDLQRLPLRQIHRKMATDLETQLSGRLSLNGSLQQSLNFDADIASGAGARTNSQRGEWEIRSIQTRGSWSPTQLKVDRLHLDAFQATMDGDGIDVTLPGLDSIKARINAAAPGIEVTADAAMLQASGGGKLALQLTSAEQVVDWLQGLPLIGDSLPEVRADGAASLAVEWRGGWQQWAQGLKNPASQPHLRVDAMAQSQGLTIDVPAAAGQPATHIDVRKLDLKAQGNLVAATLSVNGDARVNETHALLDLGLRTARAGGTASLPRWNIGIDHLVASATLPDQKQPWQLQLSDNLQITAQTGADIEIRAGAGGATLTAPADVSADSEPLKVAWQPVLWRRTAQGAMTLQTSGTVIGIQPAWADFLLKKNGEGPLGGAGMRSDLLLSGDWNIQMTDHINIRAHFKRDRGDLWLLEPETAAGIRDLDMLVTAADENVNLALNWDTERAGVITARVGTRFAQRAGGWNLPDDAPLSGTVEAHVQDLTTWAFLAPPGWRIAGGLDASMRLGGTVQTPQLNGELAGKSLNFRSVLDGLDLHDGTLRATLAGSRMDIAELTFQGGTGSRAYVRGFSGNRTQPSSERGRMTAKGTIDWSGVANASEAESGIAMDFSAELQRMQVLVRNDRQMTLSGRLNANLDQGALRVRGDIKVDRASVVLPEASAPTLGDDVVIVRNADLKNPGAVEAKQAHGELKTRKPMDMEIKLDLGSDLALEGQGITTRLEGELTVRSATYGSDPFTVFGEVRTVEGRYRAWGQALNVETGVVRFNGPYTNPALDLLAIRPEIDVRAGVRVTGTLTAPRVQLYSDPDLPEGEKLSWVVLGRATVIAGAEGSSMQQAALGLAAGQLSGKLASGLGLDELGLGDNGVSIGKRLSNELYLTYEQGLSGAASTLFIFYDITRRLTVRAQTGEASAVDMIYTIKFD